MSYDAYPEEQKIQSELEKRFFYDCRVAGLPIRAQFTVGNIHADFALPERKIVIEVDSKAWHSTEEQKENDKKRDEIYRENGWSVVRLNSFDIYKNGEKIAYFLRYGRDFQKEEDEDIY